VKRFISVAIIIVLILLIPFTFVKLNSKEFCNGTTQAVGSKQIFLKSKYKVWEHLFKIQREEETLFLRFLNDSKNFKPRNKIIWYSPMRSYYPDKNDMKYLSKFLSKVDIGGISDGKNIDGDGWGLPENVEKYKVFYELCINKTYDQVALLARSRGASSFISYVRQSSSPSFSVLAGIYPVIDWKSYPSFNILSSYTNKDENYLNLYNPGREANLQKFVNKIDKILLLHGTQDFTVPYSENSFILSRFPNVQIELIKGEGHNYSDKFYYNDSLIKLFEEYFFN